MVGYGLATLSCKNVIAMEDITVTHCVVATSIPILLSGVNGTEGRTAGFMLVRLIYLNQNAVSTINIRLI